MRPGHWSDSVNTGIRHAGDSSRNSFSARGVSQSNIIFTTQRPETLHKRVFALRKITCAAHICFRYPEATVRSLDFQRPPDEFGRATALHMPSPADRLFPA